MARSSPLEIGMSRNIERTETETLQQQIREIEELGDSTFRRFRWDVVSHYRRHEEDQEQIAIALNDKRVCTSDRHAKDRVREVLAMLDHVHDPFITH